MSTKPGYTVTVLGKTEVLEGLEYVYIPAPDVSNAPSYLSPPSATNWTMLEVKNGGQELVRKKFCMQILRF